MNFLLLLLINLLHIHSPKPTVISTDICILGGSEAAFTAAIQAARMNKQVVLIEPTGHPGGMIVEGLGKDIRFGSGRIISGIAAEFYEAVEAKYGLEPAFDQPKWFSHYEPHVAAAAIEEMLAKEKNIQIIRKIRIKEQGGVIKKKKKIKKVILEDATVIEAKLFIDASIEGHLLHFAGITTETIREGNQKYNETKNGIQINNTYRQFQVQVDPYKIAGDSTSGLIYSIQPGKLGNYGAPDHHIQGFCYRMCLTDDPNNRLPIEQPANYDPTHYEIYRRYLKAGGKLFQPRPNRHNRKTDIGSWHDLSANLYGQNWKYPTGDYATQDSLVQYHKDFTLGLLWFLQNDKQVDSLTRSQWINWGLPKDEFVDNDHWPRRLYIRSARRMLSDYVITEHHTKRKNNTPVEDAVALAWWPPDTHHARRIVRDGYAYNEGFVFGKDDWRPFGISYQALVPKRSECTNLLTPTCPSASYVAYGAIRIVPTFMMLGQSVGTAAAMALDQKKAVQDVAYSQLKSRLLKDQLILTLPENWLKVITIYN
ncbi:MAG: FAD-dependent oxidoreductase [Bacteroidota bacterium]